MGRKPKAAATPKANKGEYISDDTNGCAKGGGRANNAQGGGKTQRQENGDRIPPPKNKLPIGRHLQIKGTTASIVVMAMNPNRL